MKTLILASLSGLALLSVAACSDTDETSTNSVGAPAAPVTSDGTGGNTASGAGGGAPASPDGPVNSTANDNQMQTIETETDRPESGTGGANQTVTDSNTLATQPPPSGATAQ